ncbi:MAG: bifunctional DNA-formamidopyrimidine glycosylase/DNA-(apurinic or apyrimidinic site) lyase [Candidatus Pacebacteria bacterium]|nr:bifunctional DNA-formamidopyrimidine glycosylase/DNA-(apurinic or apyrimidinic site) lyase [Candidatus Paceibacterota bacterium]
MPELPEVEIVRQRLDQVLVGKEISEVKVLRQKSFQGEASRIKGTRIESVERRAKLIRLRLTGPDDLLVHLKMTGQLIFVDGSKKVGGGHPTDDWCEQLPGDHTRIIVKFVDQTQLFFNDLRVFGWIKVADDQAIRQEFDKYGPDVNTADFTPEYLHKKLARRTIPIKQALLIGSIVGGIGNIYASEALFEARIDPRQPANELSLQELERLVKALKQVIKQAIKSGGTTFDGSYLNADGQAGNYQEKLKVYGREGESCPSSDCQAQVEKIKISGRSTFFCSSCQE